MEVQPFWTPESRTNCSRTVDAMQKAAEHVRKSGVAAKRIGVEMAFLPADAAMALRSALKDSGEGRAVRAGAAACQEAPRRAGAAAQGLRAGRRVDDGGDGEGRPATKRELFDTLRKEEVNRGLTFEYCLLTTGTSLNRAPSDYTLAEGDIMSLRPGNYHGYIGDLCRMAISASRMRSSRICWARSR